MRDLSGRVPPRNALDVVLGAGVVGHFVAEQLELYTVHATTAIPIQTNHAATYANSSKPRLMEPTYQEFSGTLWLAFQGFIYGVHLLYFANDNPFIVWYLWQTYALHHF